MNAFLLAVLNDAEQLLVPETERARLAVLDEDAAIGLESRAMRARNKYVTSTAGLRPLPAASRPCLPCVARAERLSGLGGQPGRHGPEPGLLEG